MGKFLHAYFSPLGLRRAVPQVWDGFQTNIKLMVIAEILVLGYHHQIVSHVPPKTEVGFSIYVGAAGRDCPNGVYWTDHDLPSKLRPMLSGRFSRGIDEYFRSSSEECVKAGCLGFSKAVKEPGGSFWSRLFGSKASAAPEPADSVRASASLQICGENCGKRKLD